MIVSRILAAIALVIATASIACATYTGFEDLTLGTRYAVGTTFGSNGLNFKVVPFNFGTGQVSVYQSPYTAATGNEISMGYSIGLEFQLSPGVSEISLRYAEFSDGSGLKINGVSRYTPGLVSLDGATIEGATFEVSSTGAGNDEGFLRVTGNIHSFIVGGTEFLIDDVTVHGQRLSGDFDQEGDVDGRDFLLWQRGASPDPLSASDLEDWQGNYGVGMLTATEVASPVPEPGSLILVCVMMVLVPARLRCATPRG